MEMQGDDLEKVFRQNLKHRRQELGMTQVELAKASGVPQPNISAFERGETSPGIAIIARLAEALRCPPSALLSAEIADLATV
jgi:hypothetical protein